jgi:hypothetical protein
VIAGKGFLDRECKESIIQCDRFNDLRATNDARLSGTSLNRFKDRSNECKLLATGARLDTLMVVIELSVRLRCLRNRHLEGGRNPAARRFGVLPFR